MNPLYIYLVTPCKNIEDTVDVTIESVLNQSFDGILHYHIQDGASKDSTTKRLIWWQKHLWQHPWCTFTFASTRDTGMYDAIARGFASLNIQNSDAYMGWINADDVLLPGALKTVAAIHKQHPSIAWIGGTEHVTDVAGQICSPHTVPYFPQKMLASGLCDGTHWSLLQQEGTFWKKALWDKVGGVERNFRLAGDWDLWRRMSQYAPYVALSRPLGSFSRRAGQLSGDIDAYEQEIVQRLTRKTRDHAALQTFCASCRATSDWRTPLLREESGKWIMTEYEGMTSKRRALLLLSGLGLGRMVQAYRIWKKEHSASCLKVHD